MEDKSAMLQHLKQAIIPGVCQSLDSRFTSFREDDVYKDMHWVNPACWQADAAPELEEIGRLADHFTVTLDVHGFQKSRVKKEWRNLKITVKHFYSGVTSAHEVWEQLLL